MRLSQVTDKLLSQGYLDSRKLFSMPLQWAVSRAGIFKISWALRFRLQR